MGEGIAAHKWTFFGSIAAALIGAAAAIFVAWMNRPTPVSTGERELRVSRADKALGENASSRTPPQNIGGIWRITANAWVLDMSIDQAKDNTVSGSMKTISCPVRCEFGYTTTFQGSYDPQTGAFSFERRGSPYDEQLYRGKVTTPEVAEGTFEQKSQMGVDYKFVMQRHR